MPGRVRSRARDLRTLPLVVGGPRLPGLKSRAERPLKLRKSSPKGAGRKPRPGRSAPRTGGRLERDRRILERLGRTGWAPGGMCCAGRHHPRVRAFRAVERGSPETPRPRLHDDDLCRRRPRDEGPPTGPSHYYGRQRLLCPRARAATQYTRRSSAPNPVNKPAPGEAWT